MVKSKNQIMAKIRAATIWNGIAIVATKTQKSRRKLHKFRKIFGGELSKLLLAGSAKELLTGIRIAHLEPPTERDFRGNLPY